MCNCKQKSKEPAGGTGNFNYVFICTKDDGSEKEIKVTAGNDNEAKQLAELDCDGVKISKRRSKVKAINPSPTNFHHGEHISTICDCGVDYSESENGGGGNCAHYVCNKDLWKITNQDGIRYNCPSGFGINANDLKNYCSNNPGDWDHKANANEMTGQGLVFGEKSNKIKHVGIYESKSSTFHYGFGKKRVLKNPVSWWEKEYDALYFFQRANTLS
ncbi:hypothetical protein [Mangrovimonas sp. DI 80]|uniref:hypothetical protein n=1 Tax=Mangrovimonas sp. DI 80 TaxID=1779330 RepID=UPI000976569F|nr:hypothetical protein [Mangrovimonas sp. DI 80]OMP30062.1 hypothetical protein BKM32_14385 [Mangrovimonas sp. DI 80]